MATETVTVTYTRGSVTFTASVPVTDPVAAGFPSAANTGTKVTALKAYTGPWNLTSTVANPVILDGYLIGNGDLYISGPGIIVRNCKFTSTTPWPLMVDGASSSWAQIYDNTFITGPASECSFIMNSYAIASRNNVSGSSDGIRGKDWCTAQDNYVHDLYYSGSEHNDGIDFESQVGHWVIQHNTVVVKQTETSCITAERETGNSTLTDILIDNNLLSGAGYCIYGPGQTRGAVTNCRITNNKFSKTMAGNFPNYGYYGPVAYMPVLGGSTGNIISGNVDNDTGALV